MKEKAINLMPSINGGENVYYVVRNEDGFVRHSIVLNSYSAFSEISFPQPLTHDDVARLLTFLDECALENDNSEED